MLVLYDNPMSGNAYKVRLMLAHLDTPYERVEVGVADRSDRPQLLGDKNPAQRIPVLQLADGTFLAESNAILFYLADGTAYLSDDRLERARTLQWLFFEQYDHEPGVAVARWLSHFMPDSDRLDEARAKGRKAIAAMDAHLREHEFLVGGRYSIADIALYAYTHAADEAGIALEDFPAVQAWLARVAGQPGHVPIDA